MHQAGFLYHAFRNAEQSATKNPCCFLKNIGVQDDGPNILKLGHFSGTFTFLGTGIFSGFFILIGELFMWRFGKA